MACVSIITSDLLLTSIQAEDLEALVEEFAWWKGDLSREYASPLFGKDSASISPTVNGVKYSLRHVHLPPLNDQAALGAWAKRHRLGARKQSDRVLFYVQESDRFYLVAIVNDPGAHELMRMGDPQSRSYMTNVVKEAERMLAQAPA